MKAKALIILLILVVSLSPALVHSETAKTVMSPISIDSNDSLVQIAESMGWSGTGTSKDPYLIENISVSSNGTSSCISLENVDMYLVISNCEFFSPASTAIEISHCSHIRIENSSFGPSSPVGTYVGVDISYSSDIEIRGNSFEVKMSAVKVFLSNDINISENTIEKGDVAFTGIDVLNSNNIQIFGNSIKGNGSAENPFDSSELPSIGIETYDSKDILMDSNSICNMSMGILARISDNLLIKRNHISRNYVGISAYASSGMIYHNDFINNTIQAAQKGDGVRWNKEYPIGGNYWSDYAGKDVKSGPNQDGSGSDGIGDVPYSKYQNCTDNYPLMMPFENFTQPEYSGNGTLFYVEIVGSIIAVLFLAMLVWYWKKKT